MSDDSLADRVGVLEERLSQVEAAVLYGPPNQPSQAALDIAAKREIEELRNAIRAHRDALAATACGRADYKLWQHVAEGS